MIKCIAIADTHGTSLNEIKIPNGDIIIHAGDMLGDGSIEGLVFFAREYGKLPHKYKICIAGNHDLCLESNPGLCRNILKESGIIYLQDELIEIEGIKIYGTPWTPIFRDWAFMKDSEGLKRAYGAIPSEVDILITHGPAFGFLDQAYEHGSHLGSQELLNELLGIKYRWHIAGHVHGHYGRRGKNINCSLLNEQYDLVNKPIVIKI